MPDTVTNVTHDNRNATMNMNARFSFKHLVALLLLGLFAACGGGGGSNGVPPPTATSGVAALYSNATNWNDYVRNDGTNLLQASNTACTGTEIGDHNTCLHGGELRAVTVPGRSICAGLSATDTLGVFDWSCDSSTNPVRMVSTNLRRERNLADLIDFATSAWRTNSVTVSDGVTTILSTTPSVWWSNPVSVANSGGSLATAGTIYIVTTNPNAAYTLGADRLAFLVQPGVEVAAPTSPRVFISVGSVNFLWFEGAIHVQGTNNTGVSLGSVRFSRLRNVAIRGSGGIAGVSNASALVAVGLSASRLMRVTVIKAADVGADFYGAEGNLIEDITVADNTRHGLSLRGNHNAVSGVKAYGNGSAGIAYSGPQTFQQVYASDNEGFGIVSYSGMNSRISNVTAVNNNGTGLALANDGPYVSDTSFVANLASANNRSGFGLWHTTGGTNPAPARGTFANLATGHNGSFGVSMQNSSNNRFTGLLKVGNNVTNCGVTSGTNPGLVTGTCANQGASDATLTTGVSLAASLKGKVTSDDAVNTSDASGLAAYDTLSDWLGFANEARGWGLDGGAFPGADHRGRCVAGLNCRIWDFSPSAADTIVRAVLPKFLNGNVASTLTHVWSVTAPASQADCTAAVPGSVFAAGECRNIFLRNAVEILGDAVGNDNGLCESNERCLYTPNIGAYQGHGVLVSAGNFASGDTLSSVQLFEYAVNGR